MDSENTIFFSYSRDDSEFVLNLAKNLRKAGATVWLDQLDISAGARWDSSIEKALSSSKTLLVVLSSSSVKSHNVMDEVSYALEEQKTVVPILLEACEIPFRLRRLQYADFSGDYEIGVDTLIKALKLDKNVALKLTDGSIEKPSEAKVKRKQPLKFKSEPHKASKTPKAQPVPLQDSTLYPDNSNLAKKKNLLLLGGIIAGLALLVFLVVLITGPDEDVQEVKTENEVQLKALDSLSKEGMGKEVPSIENKKTVENKDAETKTITIEYTPTTKSTKPPLVPSLQTITIEGQTWTAKNVDVKVDNSVCYQDDPYNCTENGALYTYDQAIVACKNLGAGWRLPNDFDWKKLTRAYGGATGDLSSDESSGKKAFKNLVRGGTTNFKGSLAGKKIYNTDNFYYYDYNRIGYYWSITKKKPHEANQAIIYTFRIDDERLLRESMPATDFASCRCIKD